MRLAALCRCSALVGALVSSCASEAVEMPPVAPIHWLTPASGHELAPSPPTPTDKERKLAQVYLEALESPRFGELGALLVQDAHFAAGARDVRGRDLVVKKHDEMLGAFDERRFAAGRIWLTDSTRPLDTQALEWTMTGVHARDWMGVAATRKPVVIRGLTLFWLSDEGIISDAHMYFDEEVVKAELGEGPAELRKLPLPSAETGPAIVLERTGAQEETKNVEVVRAMLRALENNDEKAFLSTLTEDVDVTTLDRAEPARGRQAAHAYFDTMRKALRHLDTVVQNGWGVRSFAVVEYAVSGLLRAPLPRVAGGMNRAVHTQYVDIIEIRDGKVARIWRYSDPISFGSL